MSSEAARTKLTDARAGSARTELVPALLVLVSAWCLLAAQALLGPHVGHPAAVFVSFLAVTALVLATRARDGVQAPGRAALAAGLAALAGGTSFPVFIAAIAGVGGLLGLDPVAPPARPEAPLSIVSVLILAPVFEELLYRERVLLALRPRLGRVGAVALSSVLFALPHLEAWPLLATFLVGLALGALMLATRSLALCIGLHAGLNLAAVVCGIPPARFALSFAPALACGAGLLALAVASARRVAKLPTGT